MKEIPVVSIKTLDRISPSQFDRFRNCPYSYVLRKSLPKTVFAKNPNAKLGTLWHKLVERIHDGVITDEESLKAQWDAGITLIDNDRDPHQAPVKWEVKNFAMFYYSLQEKLKRGSTTLSQQSRDTSKQKIFGTEVNLDVYPFKGSIDLLYYDDSGIHIVDYKTGPHLEPFEDGYQVKPIYKDQLKIYAAMVVKSNLYTTVPKSLKLQALSGHRDDVDFSIEECLKIFQEGEELLEAVNDVIRANGRVDELANVSPENCKRCDVRVFCRRYIEERSRIFDKPIDIVGAVARVSSSARIRKHNLLLRDNEMEYLVRDVPWDYFRHLEFPTLGTRLFVMNIKGLVQSTFQFGKHTLMYKITGQTASPVLGNTSLRTG
jgi:hypothetical protein